MRDLIAQTGVRSISFVRAALYFAVMSVLVFLYPAVLAADGSPYKVNDWFIDTNDSGVVVWQTEELHFDGEQSHEHYHILLDNGYRVTQLSPLDSLLYNEYPKINDAGWVTWCGQDEEIPGHEIFLYNGQETLQLTNNSFGDHWPQINNNGWVVWGGGAQVWQPSPRREDNEIFLYNGTEVIQLTDNDLPEQTDYQINDHGWVVWQTIFSDNKRDLFLYDGEATMQITDNDHADHSPMINNNGLISWIQHSFEETDRPYAIMLYDGDEIVELSGDGHVSIPENFAPQINEKGWVTWGGDNQIFLYDGTATVRLTANSVWDKEPQINDDGWVVWSGWDGHDYELFLYDGTETIQVTDNAYNDERPQMNNLGWDLDAVRKSTELTEYDRNRMGLKVAQPGNVSGDKEKPRASVSTPFVSTRISKTNTFKVNWSATDPAPLAWQSRKDGGSAITQTGGSGIKSYTVYYRPSTSETWRTWKKDVRITQADFTGKAGVTYYFRVRAEDNAGNYGWSKVRKTTIPFNEGMSLIRKVGFNGYLKNSNSPYFLSSVRYSYTRGNTLVYKLYNNNGIGLVTTKGPNRGKAKIYVDGKYVKTIDAYKSSLRPRQLAFYRGFNKKGTHWLKIENLGTPGRSRFDVDGIVVVR